MKLLELNDVHATYGISQVLFGVSLEVREHEVVALVGRNGVGKTTTLRTIMGLTPPSQGSVRWRGREIAGLPPYQIAQLGIGFVPEDRRIFPELTVWENLDVARRERGAACWTEARIYTLFPDLEPIANRKGGYLSGGEQQMLTIARSLMTNPELLLLDEPAEGLAPLVVEALRGQIGALREEGLSIVLAEQNLDLVLALADRIYFLEKGQIPCTATPAAVRADPELIRRYLIV